MAGSASISGLASGLDTASIISQLMQLDNGAVRVIQTQLDAQMRETHIDFTAAFDGKDYGVDAFPGLTYALTRVDDRTYVLVAKRDGVLNSTTLTVVSPEGNTRTSTTVVVNADGRTVANIAVYDRVQ